MIARKWWLEDETFPTVGKPTALVVDDPPTSLNATARTLEGFGFVVFTAGSAREAERVAEHLKGPLDLLMTDASLPDARGDVLARRVRSGGLDPAVLYTSGHARKQLYTRGFGGLNAPLIRKPFSKNELAERVRRLLAL